MDNIVVLAKELMAEEDLKSTMKKRKTLQTSP